MRFIVIEKEDCDEVHESGPKGKTIAIFYDNVGMAHDYVDFLNDKYVDKEVNAEWPSINREKRIKYHIEQLNLLFQEKRLYWNEHGNEVE